ncbi:MAG: LptA/OstA family protein [Pseudomonadota bacterium]
MTRAFHFSAALLSALLLALPVAAQGLNLGGGAEDGPIEITAENGIEWWEPKQLYIARGNAKASRGEVDLFGDELTAHYRTDKAGDREIWRLDAVGNVRIKSPSEEATGEVGAYDVDRGILVLTGKVRLDTPEERVTANRSLEYWTNENMAVARGEAIAIREDRRLSADVLVAYFHAPDAAGKRKLRRLEAYTDVHVSTPTEIVRGDRGVYEVESGIATVTGSVKITRGKDQMNGERAEVDMKSGVSRLLTAPAGGGRVKAIITPSKEKEKSPK